MLDRVYFIIVIYGEDDLLWLHRFFCISRVYAAYHDNQNRKDGSYGHLNNQYTQNAYGFHN